MKPYAAGALALLTLVPAVVEGAAPLYALAWTATGFFDQRDFAIDLDVGPSGDAYLAGQTRANYGSPESDLTGGLVAAYSSSGQEQWLTRAYDGPGADTFRSVGVDPAGAVYLSGTTFRFPGGAEPVLIKHTPDGQPLWERRFGSPESEAGGLLAIDPQGSTYVAGSTRGQVGQAAFGGWDPFVTKHSADGDHLWTRQYGAEVGEFGYAIAAGPGDALLLVGGAGRGGTTLSRLAPDGSIEWTSEPNYSTTPNRETSISAVAVDPSGAIVTVGSTNVLYDSGLGFQEGDAYVAKHAPDGGLLWRHVMPSDTYDTMTGVAVDAAGSVYFGGITSAGAGSASGLSVDGLWGKLSPEGTLVTTHTIATDVGDFVTGVAFDPAGPVYVSGYTSDHVVTPDTIYVDGERDAFLMRFNPVPEPAAVGMVTVLGGMLACRRRR